MPRRYHDDAATQAIGIPVDPPLIPAARRDRWCRRPGRDTLAEHPGDRHAASAVRPAATQPCDHLLPGEPLVRPLLRLRAAGSDCGLRAARGLLAAGWHGWLRPPIR